MYEVTEIKVGSLCHLHRALRGGLPRPLVLPRLTALRQKDSKPMERGKTTKLISGQGGAGSEEVAQVDFCGDRLPNSLAARRKTGEVLASSGPQAQIT